MPLGITGADNDGLCVTRLCLRSHPTSARSYSKPRVSIRGLEAKTRDGDEAWLGPGPGPLCYLSATLLPRIQTCITFYRGVI